jgi:hypothetical protein
MAFDPGIIVTDPESSDIAMVVEVKTDLRDLDSSERHLQRFMSNMGCPVACWSLRGFSGCTTTNIHRCPRTRSHKSGSLATESGLGELPADLKRAALFYIVPIVPAIAQGSVRAGHPREPLAASKA